MIEAANQQRYNALQKKKRQQKINRKIAWTIAASDPGSSAYKALWTTGDHAFNRTPLYPPGSIQAEAARALWRADYRWRLGSRIALLDAFAICREHRWPYPNWLGMAVEDLTSKALFDEKAFKAENIRVAQLERTRLQMQKHCQIFHAIKLRQSGDQVPEWRRGLLSPLEMDNVTARQLEAANTDGKRHNLASRILPRAKGQQRVNSAIAIEANLKKQQTEVYVQFGTGTSFALDPECYLWDVPFLHPATIESLKLPYLQ